MSNTTPQLVELPGEHFAVALRSGIHRVIAKQETLNRINVFPVADGDTGTNLTLSLCSALPVLAVPGSQRIGELLVGVADALLDGARGNSGAIVAQFFQGMSDSAGELGHFTLDTLANAIEFGNRYAHDALAKPREGTILSVMSAFSASLSTHVAERGGDAKAALTLAIADANQALVRTEEQLDVLRKAGVVDAGAKGFVELVEGMADFLVDGTVTERPDLMDHLPLEAEETAGVDSDIEFRYCTECMITGTEIDRRKIREQLSGIGNSLVIAGTKMKAKIHVHVNDPEHVFSLARTFGTVSGEKADDMKRQQSSTHNIKVRFAVITDSAADIPDDDLERHDIHMVPMRIQFGDRGYLDKISLTPETFFAKLKDSPVHPTTSQPTPGDFRRQYQYLASHFPDVVSISLTPKVSGTWQAAVAAAERSGGPGRVHVVDSLNASLGQGQLAVFAAECAAAGLDIDTTLRALAELIPVTRSFALVRDLRYAVRGGRVPTSKKWLADLLRVTPVLQTEGDGRISAQGIIPGRRNLLPKFARYVARRSNPDVQLRVSIGHALCADEATELEHHLNDLLPKIVKTGVTDLGSAIGVHGGPGCIVVGVQEYRPPADFQ